MSRNVKLYTWTILFMTLSRKNNIIENITSDTLTNLFSMNEMIRKKMMATAVRKTVEKQVKSAPKKVSDMKSKELETQELEQELGHEELLDNVVPKQDHSTIPTEVGNWLNSIGVVLNEEQRREVNIHLRMKQIRSGIQYVRTTIPYNDEKMKLPNQAQSLLAGLSDHEPRTTGEWLKHLDGVLTTKQLPERVLNFYKRRLESLGLIARV